MLRSPATRLSLIYFWPFVVLSVFEDAPPSPANVQHPQGVKSRVQSWAVQLYQHNLQLALEIKFRMQGNWRAVYRDSGRLASLGPPLYFQQNTLPRCQRAAEEEQLHVSRVRIYSHGVWIKPLIVYELSRLFRNFIVFWKKYEDAYNWIVLCSFQKVSFVFALK